MISKMKGGAMNKIAGLFSVVGVVLILQACSKVSSDQVESSSRYQGSISIDGSSTVFPISEGVAEAALYNPELSELRIGVNMSGTGGGFKKFCKGEIDITGASRPIKPSEIKMCEEAKVGFVELPIAYDGISVVRNRENACVSEMSVEQLRKIWEPAAEGKITNWSQISKNCPDMELKLYGPGLDSGTFDYFTAAIVGKEGQSRPDFTKSEDDNILAMGIAGDKGALGYFGFAYYLENKDKVESLAIIPEAQIEGVKPQVATIADGSYKPLARPIFIYVSTTAAQRPEVKAFIKFYIDQAAEMASSVGYVALGDSEIKNNELYRLVQSRFDSLSMGSLFGAENVNVEALLRSSEQ